MKLFTLFPNIGKRAGLSRGKIVSIGKVWELERVHPIIQQGALPRHDMDIARSYNGAK